MLSKTKQVCCFIGLFCFIQIVNSQALNDYRSVNDGDWDLNTTWEVYTLTGWNPASNFPGETGITTNDVYIIGNHTVGIDTDILGTFNSLIIGDEDGTDDTLEINGNSSIQTQNIILKSDGYILWSTNSNFTIPNAASISVDTGGGLTNTSGCSAAKRLYIGAVLYTVCNGGANTNRSFDEVNDAGGTFNVNATSDGPICLGETLNLFAAISGTDSDDIPITYTWTVISPTGQSVDNINNQNTTDTPNTAATYTYEIEAETNSGIINTDTIIVVVGGSPNTPVNDGNKSWCNANKTISATVNTGETVDWYDSLSGGILLQANSTSYTPLTPGDYYAEAKNPTTNCVSIARVKITIKPCYVITNRRITHRTNP